jgi:hypothetical protein
MLTDNDLAREADGYWYQQSYPTSSPGFIGDKPNYGTEGYQSGYSSYM